MTRTPAHLVGRSVDGRPLLAEWFGDTGPVWLVVCGIHGNEASSVAFGERLRSRLRRGWAARRGVRFVLLQVANPDGVAAGTRTNARGVDLNRNFPASNYEPGGVAGPEPESEPETRAVRRLIEDLDPDTLLAIHCCEPLFDWDGPARPLAEALAAGMPESLRFPVEKLGANPGSLGSWAGVDRDLPVVTVEFDCHGATDIRDQLDAVEEGVDAALATLPGEGRGRGSPFRPDRDPGDEASFGATRRRYGDQVVHLERLGELRDGGPLLLVDGADERPARHVFESLRRRLLHRRSLARPVVVASRVAADSDDPSTRRDSVEPPEELVAAIEPYAIVTVAGGDRDGYRQRGLDAVDFADRAAELPALDDEPNGSRAARDQNTPALHLAVSTDHAEGRGADDVPSAARFYELVDLLVGGTP